MKSAKLKPFDKYEYYLDSVQSPDEDVKFLRRTYKEATGKLPKIMREDFCGTFNLTCEWVKLDKSHLGIGVDLDPEPLEYGKTHNFLALKQSEKERVTLLQENVLTPTLPKADIINALNFSYWIFKKREDLKKYFANCYKTLNDDGVFVVDCFGGSDCQEANEHETEHEDFSYYWDQDSFDPISNEAMFYIHFKRKGEAKRERVFSYDWRMWSIPEVRDLMAEVGFKESVVYWEGTDEEGEGDGEFTLAEVGEECESWVAYIVGKK